MAAFARSFRLAAPAAARIAPRAAMAAPSAASMAARAGARSFTTTQMNLIRKYTKEHEWIDISADQKSATVGITEYAAEALGDIVYVELPETTGDYVSKGDAFAAVESVKSASDIGAPLRCRVVSVNSDLDEKPSIMNRVPEDDSAGGGWVAKVELDEASVQELDDLLTAEDYKKYVDEVDDH